MNQQFHQRPRARYDEQNRIIVQASAALDCRRALWYELTGHERTDKPDPSRTITVRMSVALRDVLIDAMGEKGFSVSRLIPGNFIQTPVNLTPGIMVVGRPTAIVTADPAYDGDPDQRPVALALKTRGDNGYKRWQHLGAERSHPETVVQAAIYSMGLFKDERDVIITTLNTAEREWDTERVPAERVASLLGEAEEHLAELAAHNARNAASPQNLPERDFDLADYQCRSCPFLTACDPPNPGADEDEDEDPEMITDSEAEMALDQYTESKELADRYEAEKKAASALLLAWMNQNGEQKTRLGGRTISVLSPKRYSYNSKLLNELLDPETREMIVKESNTKPYARVF